MKETIEFVGRPVVFNDNGQTPHGRYLGHVHSVREDQVYFMLVDNNGTTHFCLPCDVKFVITSDEEVK